MNDRLSTIGSIGHRDRSRVIAAQETSQADEPQEAEESPFAGVIVIPGLWARRGWRLHGRPRRRRLHGLPRGRLRQHHRGRHDCYEGRQE
jgi:hypothetical protein